MCPRALRKEHSPGLQEEPVFLSGESDASAVLIWKDPASVLSAG